MAAKDHLNQTLFHGTTFRYGHIKKGDIIQPASAINAEPYHDPSLYTDAEYWAHATTDLSTARNYANWAANGVHEGFLEDGRLRSSYKPHVFQVEPISQVYLDPEDQTGVRSLGFRVVRRVLPNEVRPT